MNAHPLIRTKWSNERLMAIVFAAVTLYQLPSWVRNPSGMLTFIAVLAFGLALDTTANFIRFRKPVCAVSAAITAAMLQALEPGAPLWGMLLAVAVAGLVGKHVWGGTGKNPLNPAMVGLLFLYLLFPTEFSPFAPSLLLIPAILLSLPFLAVRPFAALGMMAGMTASLFLKQGFGIFNEVAFGVFFWSCLVITDPVTITPHPVVGAALGLLAGFVPLYFSGTVMAMALGVLAANAVSFVTERLAQSTSHRIRLTFSRRNRIPFPDADTVFLDLTGSETARRCTDETLARDEILSRIERNRVFGMGGAAFPTNQKLNAVMASDTKEKHLIVNGVECDPGLIHDKWLLLRYQSEIEQGIRLLTSCIAFQSVTVAVKDGKGLPQMKDVRITEVPDCYPAGAEKVLIREVLKKTLSNDTVPALQGILVLNVQTVFSIYEAVCLNRRADQRFITVANVARREGQVARVKLGANVLEIVEKFYPQPSCVFKGGGLMQACVADEGDTIDNKINFLAVGNLPVYRESPLCSKCGMCSGVCPAGLKVYEIARLVDEGKTEQTERLHPEKCIACGSCSHVCLAGRDLSSRVKVARKAATSAMKESLIQALSPSN